MDYKNGRLKNRRSKSSRITSPLPYMYWIYENFNLLKTGSFFQDKSGQNKTEFWLRYEDKVTGKTLNWRWVIFVSF